MRLLARDERGELSLIERTGDNVPQYAILSHTWDNDGEVSYSDLVAGTSNNKPGYKKIKFCVEQAARDGLEYSWVDTCCIDRWNLQELSYAINSMFLWYRNAARCYVLVSDLSTNGITDPNLYQSKLEAAFRSSRWFTRGWTLQELIAPTSVEFFSLQHHRIGDKISLRQPIHEITGIPIEALQGQNLAEYSVSERMAWVANRQTTEEEDMAYCLLGIFGVSISSMYGEGRENAMKRLQVEIERSTKSGMATLIISNLS